MAWTTARTWVAGELVTASMMNTHVRDNLNALKAPPTDLHNADEGADWSTTSATFTAIDATDLSLSLTTTGGDILVSFCGNFIAAAAAYVYLQVVLDGAGQEADDGLIAAYLDRTTAAGRPLSFTKLIQNVSAGAHTVLLNWKASTSTITLFGGAGTGGGDLHPQFLAREV